MQLETLGFEDFTTAKDNCTGSVPLACLHGFDVSTALSPKGESVLLIGDNLTGEGVIFYNFD